MTPTSTPAPRRHDWHFVAADSAQARTVVPVLIAVCRECGLMRTAVAVAQHEGRVDLRGDCPGR